MPYTILWDDLPAGALPQFSKKFLRSGLGLYGDDAASEELLGLRDDVQELVLDDIDTRLSRDPHQGKKIWRLLPLPYHIAWRVETCLRDCHAVYLIDEPAKTVTVIGLLYPPNLRGSP